MCNGVPSKPSPVISDQQGIDNQGLADKINGQAASSGSGVIGTTTIAGDGSFFDRVGTGTGGRSTRHDLPGGDTPMPVEELWKFLMDNKVELGHTTLDLLGLIPLFGEIADIANAAWYAAQGDYTMAGISTASAIPGLGWAEPPASGGQSTATKPSMPLEPPAVRRRLRTRGGDGEARSMWLASARPSSVSLREAGRQYLGAVSLSDGLDPATLTW